MDKQQLIQFRDTLLNGGVAYSHVKRSLRELQDHAEDIEQRAIKDGFNVKEAKQQSIENIGSLDILAAEILARSELKSFGRRYPKFSLVFGPVLSFVSIVILSCLLMVGLESSIGEELALKIIEPWGQAAFKILSVILTYLLAPALSLYFGFYALKNRISIKYFGWGLLILCVFASSVTMLLSWPDAAAGVQGQIGVAVGEIVHEESVPTWVYGNKLRLFLNLMFISISIFFFKKKLDRELV